MKNRSEIILNKLEAILSHLKTENLLEKNKIKLEMILKRLETGVIRS